MGLKEQSERVSYWQKPWDYIQKKKDILRSEGLPLIIELGRAPLPTEFGDWTYYAFGDLTNGSHHDVLVFGNVDNGSLGDRENILTRIHSACRTNEVFHAINCECRKQLHQAMRLISEEGRGIIIYLEQEGRGTGIWGKMQQLNGMFEWNKENTRIVQKVDRQTGESIDTVRAYQEAGLPSEIRDFEIAGEILKHMGIKSVKLLTNNPAKIAGIELVGIKVEPVEIHIPPDNEIIASDLASKAKNLDHYIREEHLKINS